MLDKKLFEPLLEKEKIKLMNNEYKNKSCCQQKK
jgi:hypothetical protein